jgi:hypothetical protein
MHRMHLLTRTRCLGTLITQNTVTDKYTDIFFIGEKSTPEYICFLNAFFVNLHFSVAFISLITDRY